MKKHIPNTLTCLNLVCGSLSIMAALKGNLEMAAIWIIVAAVFDFFDGFVLQNSGFSCRLGATIS